MFRQFGAHWLAFAGGVAANESSLLKNAVASAARAQCTFFELACHPVNQLSAKDTAQALLEGGIVNAAYCRFFPGDGSHGDPLGKNIDKALRTIDDDLDFIAQLRVAGINISHMTGPSAYCLGKKYDLSPEQKLKQVEKFLRAALPMIEQYNVYLCLEYLRDGEDDVLGSMGRCLEVVNKLSSPNVRMHFDTFHSLERGEALHEAILLAGKALGYVHANGSKRLPPGAFELDGDILSTDTVNWWLVSKALSQIGYQGPIVAEPFGKVIREQVPALGEGLPPPIEGQRFYDMARETAQFFDII